MCLTAMRRAEHIVREFSAWRPKTSLEIPLTGGEGVIDRRRFLKKCGTASAGVLFANCAGLQAAGFPPSAASAQRRLVSVGGRRAVTIDVHSHCIVDIRDYGIWRQNFGQTNCGNPADLNGDCLVDILELN